jgi:hypothetical protein
MLDDCFARHDLPGVFDKKAEQIEYQRLDMDVASLRSQRKLICVEFELFEAVSHENARVPAASNRSLGGSRA